MAATYTVKMVSTQNVLEEGNDKVTATAVYQIVASESTTLAAARTGSNYNETSNPTGVPLRGMSLADTTGLPCTKRSYRFADQARTLILATLDYDSTQNAVISPLDEAPIISSSGEQGEESYYADTQSPPKLARHTNNVPFDELPKRNSSIRAYDVELNVEATAGDASFSALENKVNSAAMDIDGRSCGVGTVLCSGVSLSAVKTRDSVQYKTLKCTLRYRPAGWDQRFESLGLVDVNAKPIDDGSGNPVQRPYPLTSAGAKAANATDKGFEIVLKPYAAADLAPLVADA